ncbi:HpcH/HpaI aldolase/citrate lyase family protein [Pseudarthrobacter sp. TAF60_1]|uniref:HpcH/HpaI aldolase/citrate lyase family protein n=1 Tax=Pseudarthrobacter sp. TAF60_1 TaxID=3233071 RepID=UPI003F981CB6
MMPSRYSVLPRSFMYIPGDKPELFPKAAAGTADALILDLEDAVPHARKAEARSGVRRWLTTRAPVLSPEGASGQQWWVRISAESIAADLDAVLTPALAGIFLAKCTVASLAETAECLSRLEGGNATAPQSVGVIGLVESAAALLELEALAVSERLLTFAIGEVDLMADLRMTRGPHSEAALDSIRARFVIACAATGLLPPVAPTSTAIRDLAAFEQSSRKMLELGFRSRTAVHPSQIATIHDVFTPGADEVASARDIIARFRQSQGGVAVDSAGRMIDAAVIRGAEETLRRSTDHR